MLLFQDALLPIVLERGHLVSSLSGGGIFEDFLQMKAKRDS